MAFLWSISIAAQVIVSGLGIILVILCAKSLNTDIRMMKVLRGYDKGALLQVLGIIGIIAAMIGLYGAGLSFGCRKPRKMMRLRFLLYSYLGWAGGLTALLIFSFTIIFKSVDKLEKHLKTGFEGVMDDYNKDDDIRNDIDALQKTLSCCGNKDHSDWFRVALAKISEDQVAIPESCCSKKTCTKVVTADEIGLLTPFKEGCVKKVVKLYGSILNTRAMITISIATVEAASLIIVVIILFTSWYIEESKPKQAVSEEKNKKSTKLSESKITEGGTEMSGTEAE